MSNQKQFGIWMDTQAAVIIGKEQPESDSVSILATVAGEKATSKPSEKTTHNHEKSLQAKFFKEIATHLQNATYIHVTGTGQVQEQFLHYLAETPQFKNTRTDESTVNKMSDDGLVAFMTDKLN